MSDSDLTLTIREKDIREVFVLGVVLKAIGAFFELVLGLLLMYSDIVTATITTLMGWALLQDPDNFFLNHLHALTTLSPRAQFLGGLYLASHGAVKFVLMIALLRNKAWAYPASIAVLMLFMIYEVVRFAQTHSLPTLFLFFFDAIIVWLIYHEYKLTKRRR